MDIYINLSYQDYKKLEQQARAFEETEHGEGSEYYHKAIVLNIGGVRFEFHGPNVKARQPMYCSVESPTPASPELPVLCGLPLAHAGPHSWAK